MKFKKHFLIGNPKRKRFSFGYSHFFGDFGIIDLFITLFIGVLIFAFWIIFDFLSAFILSVGFILIWTILIKQFGNEKSYDLIIDYFKYRSKFKEIKNVSSKEENIIILEIKGGINLGIETKNNVQMIIDKLNNFIKIYPGSLKLIKLNSSWDIQGQLDNFKEKFNAEKSLNIKNLQINLCDYLYELEKKKLNNRLFLIFNNPKPKELELIDNLNFDLPLERVEEEIIINLKNTFFDQAKENWNKIETPDKDLIISRAKFQREVPFGWLIYLFFESKFSFSLEINSVDATDKIKLVKKLNKQKLNYRTENEIEERKKEWLSESNNKLLEEVILYNEELKLINLITIFEETNEQDYQNLEFQNRHHSNFKLHKSYFNQQNDWNNFWGWNNGVFPTTNETVANAFPFLNLSYIDEKGLLLGRIEQRYPFIFNSWLLKDQTNLHTVILGNSGSGKTTLMKYLLAGELALSEQQTIIIDPHDEFNFLEKTKIDLSESFLNPLFFENVNPDNIKNEIQKKIFLLKEFFYLLYKDQLNQDMAQQIQKLLFDIEEKLYEKKDLLFQNIELKIGDLEIDHYLLKPITKGIYQMFNQTEKLDLKNEQIIINLKKLFLLEESTRNIILFLFIKRLKNIIYANQNSSKKISIFIDEAAKFLRNKFLLEQISPLFSESRKFNTKLTIATQNLVDVFNNSEDQVLLANIFANCTNMFIGYLKNDQRQLLDSFLRDGGAQPLSEKEHQHINKKQGHFLFIKDDKRYSFESLYDLEINKFLKIKS